LGTDIHLRVEKLVDGEWQYVKPPRVTRWGTRTWDEDWQEDENALEPGARNYNLFAFLADVRNGYGFAGTYRHEPIEPQFPGRGLPDGVDEEISYEEEDDVPYLGDHSFTWATLTELLNAPWDMEFKTAGVVPESVHISLPIGSRPDSWSGGVSGGSTLTIQVDQYDELLRKDLLDPRIKYYIVRRWTWQPLKECDFRIWLDRDLVPLADGDTDSIRVIIGFDS